MFSLNASPNKLPLGLGGQYPPFMRYYFANVLGAQKLSNGAKDADGMFYPVDYDTTTQALINTNISTVKGLLPDSGTSIINAGSKTYKIGKYQNQIRGIKGMFLGQKNTGTTTLPTIYNHLDNCVGVGSGFLTMTNDASGLRVQYHRVDGDNTITSGAVATIDATVGNGYTTIAGYNVMGDYLDTDKVVIAYIRGATLYQVIVTVDTSTLACTGSTPSNTTYTGGATTFVVAGIRTISPTKVVVYTTTQGGNTNGLHVSTISGSTFTHGAQVLQGGNLSVSNCWFNSIVVWNDNYVVAVSSTSQSAKRFAKFTISGTTLTASSVLNGFSGSYTEGASMVAEGKYLLGGDGYTPVVINADDFSTQVITRVFTSNQRCLQGYEDGDTRTANCSAGVVSYTSGGASIISSEPQGAFNLLNFVKKFDGFTLETTGVSLRAELSDLRITTSKTIDIAVDGTNTHTAVDVGLYTGYVMSTVSGNEVEISVENNSGTTMELAPLSLLSEVS